MTAQSTNPSSSDVQDFDPFDSLHLYIEGESPESEALPSSLVKAFAEATGWELAKVGDEIKIVDMSANWPARTPTAHRGNCDRLAEELSQLLK